MTECRFWTEAIDYRKKCRCGTNLFRHLNMILPHHIARINPISSLLWRCRVYHFPLPVVWTCSQYPFHHHKHQMELQGVSITTGCQQHGRAGCIPFHCQQYGRAGCIPFRRQQHGRPQPEVWTCRVCPFPPLAVWTRRVYSFPPPAVWTCTGAVQF
jgi:hypothetical protein